VIVVTHNDQLARKSKERDRISEAIDRLYMKKSKVYPEIVAVEFVACHEGKRDFNDIIKLTSVLCYAATKVEASSGKSVIRIYTLIGYYIFRSSSRAEDEAVTTTCS